MDSDRTTDEREAEPGFRHAPVLLAEVVELFAPVPPGVVVDATVGGGGHSEAILDAHPHLRVVGLDRDPAAVAAAARRLERFGERAVVRHERFDRLVEAVDALDARPVSGVLFDLGVSSHQLDTPGRGFSYHDDGPVDMRMDTTAQTTAADLLNELDERELADLLQRYSDERHARRIAAAIVAGRPITSTTQLASIVRDAIPAPARRRGGHPARRTFQALRIAVNDELRVLEKALRDAIDLLEPEGRGAVLAYHSGEDRLVKQIMREAETGGCQCPTTLPCACGAVPVGRVLRRGGWVPSREEIEANPRARSCRLRAVEKLPGRPRAALAEVTS
jgi:16S rRNA (cytosine1402-N4)-methyltransferase